MNSWKVLDSYFLNHLYPFTNHHIDSYRELLRTFIPDVVKKHNPITMIKGNNDDIENIDLKTEIYIGGINGDKIYIDRPVIIENGVARLLTPSDARLRNLTYQTNIYASIDIVITSNKVPLPTITIKKPIPIGSIPIMLHSDACVLNNQSKDVLRKLGECIYDQGGYFIIDGKEKVIVSQERVTNNCIFINSLKDDEKYDFRASIRCVGTNSVRPKTTKIFRLEKDEINIPFSSGALFVSIPNVDGNIPLFIVFRALGIVSDEQIVNMMLSSSLSENEKDKYIEFIKPSLIYRPNNTENIYSQEAAIKYIQYRTAYKLSKNYTRGIILLDFLPNLELPQEKAQYLAYIVIQFANVVLGIKPESDKDSYVYKRIDTSGMLITDLFIDAYSQFTDQINSTLNKIYNYGAWKNNGKYEEMFDEANISKIISSKYLTEIFLKSMKMKWGANENDDLRVVQDLSRISYIGYLSHLRRLNLPLDRSLKLFSPHRLHPHQFGFVCPYETPDGSSIGLLKNLAYLTRISSGTSEECIKECLDFTEIVYKLSLVQNVSVMSKDIAKVFINGTWYGICLDPNKLFKILKTFKSNNIINVLTSIAWNIQDNEIRILSESSRPVRPFIRVKNGAIRKHDEDYNWFKLIGGSENDILDENIYTKDGFRTPKGNISIDQLIDDYDDISGCIEYLDIEEIDTSLIAMTPDDINTMHTHCEIHPSLIMSVVSANIPLANHSFAARNIFHAAQSKQAISVYATNFNERFDTMSYVYHYPQKPIINTRLSHYTHSDKMPNGFNIIVAVMSYSGYNQEDSLMINRSAIERGFESLSYYKSISLTAKTESIDEKTIFINPKVLINQGHKVIGFRDKANYSYLNDDGIITENVYVPQGTDVAIIGMVLVRSVTKEVRKGMALSIEKVDEYVDKSFITDNNVYGIVDKIYVSKRVSDEGGKICKVRMLKIKKPEFGDKHSSRHGQKGVIGRIFNECDMPFTKEGIRPDIIMNSHAFPSRMTIGHIVECVFAKLCCMKGSFGDGTIFMDFDKEAVFNELETVGFNKHGNEVLYNGMSGKMIDTDIFIGPVYYFRLKHMVAEKINARGTGPMTFLTRQPTEGRRKGGGLRIGEMERDALLAHGISEFVRESMMVRSDNYSVPVCNRCGVLAITGKDKFYCPRCDEQDIVNVKLPYSFKLLSQEMEAMSLNMFFNTSDNFEIPEKDIEVIEQKELPIIEGFNNNNNIHKKLTKKDKKCPEGTVLNPKTNRCISAKGAIAKKLQLVGGSLGGSDGGSLGGSDGESDGGSLGGSDGGSLGGSDGGSLGGSDSESDGGSDGGSDSESDGGSDGGSLGGSDGGSLGGIDGGSDGGSLGGSVIDSHTKVIMI